MTNYDHHRTPCPVVSAESRLQSLILAHLKSMAMVVTITGAFAMTHSYALASEPLSPKLWVVDHHAFLLKADGTLWAWGDNSNYALGLGDNQDRYMPTLVDANTNQWVDLAPGVSFTLARKADRTLWAWGNGGKQLGLSGTALAEWPTQVGIDTDWIAISAHITPSMGIKSDGTLWTWGENRFGSLGQGDTGDKIIPTQVQITGPWAKATATWNRAYVIKTNGELWTFGQNAYGSLGIGEPLPSTCNPPGTFDGSCNAPMKIGAENKWLYISAGYDHTLALKKDHSLWVWGNNGDGELGAAVPTGYGSYQSSPVMAGVDKDWTQVSAGRFFSLGIKSNGTLWAWGYNGDGMLGLDDYDRRITPTNVPSKLPLGNQWLEVSAGRNFALARATDGSVWAWGNNAFGQLGLGVNGGGYKVPTQIAKSDHIATTRKPSQLNLVRFNGWSTILTNTDSQGRNLVISAIATRGPISVAHNCPETLKWSAHCRIRVSARRLTPVKEGAIVIRTPGVMTGEITVPVTIRK